MGKEEERIYRMAQAQQDGDAKLFFEKHLHQLCYDHAGRNWYIWKKHYWAEDLVEEIITKLNAVIKIYKRESVKWHKEAISELTKGNKDSAKEAEVKRDFYLKKISLLQKRSWKREVISLAASGETRFAITGNEWDKNPWLLGCPNGVLDLETGEFRAGCPADYIRTICPTEWKGYGVPAPTWNRFLKDIFGGNEDLILYIQRLIGYAVSGQCNEHILPIFWGRGRNGKGVFFETLLHVLGPLMGPIKAETLLDQGRSRSADCPDPAILAFRGKRIAWASETDKGRRLDVSRVKWLVGGDSLVGRAPYGKRAVTFPPTHTLFLMTNNKPHADADDFALWQRIHLIPFEFQFVDDPQGPNQKKRDSNLLNKLKAEASGILSWIATGCTLWRCNGLNPPKEVTLAVEEYRNSEDTIQGFLDDCCNLEPQSKVGAGELYQSYKEWCTQNERRPIDGKSFGETMKKKFVFEHTRIGNFYYGIGLLPDTTGVSLLPDTTGEKVLSLLNTN